MHFKVSSRLCKRSWRLRISLSLFVQITETSCLQREQFSIECIFQLQLILLPLFCICQNVNTFYVPGVAPVEFVKGQSIMVKAVKMTSTRTQLPYEYYSLQFCLPKNGTIVYKSENLGEVLRGDRIVNTPYDVQMAENINCKLLCNTKDRPLNWNAEQSSKVSERIEHEYYVHL